MDSAAVSEASTAPLAPEDRETPLPTSWRRKVNRAAARVSAIAGIVAVFAGIAFVEQEVAKIVLVTAGILVMQAGIWYMAHPILTNERHFTGLRDELDNFTQLVRQLNKAAVADGPSSEIDRVRVAMHASVDRMGKLAGIPDEPPAS
jgi:hypothetical protein